MVDAEVGEMFGVALVDSRLVKLRDSNTECKKEANNDYQPATDQEPTPIAILTAECATVSYPLTSSNKTVADNRATN